MSGSSTIVLATRNTKKVPEIQAILTGAGLDAELVGLDGYPGMPAVPETEPTFSGNALLKARAVAQYTGLPALADDSGLRVDALNGMPGVLSARWSGRFGEQSGEMDRANLELVLDQLADTPQERRGAEFVCAAAFVLPNGTEGVVEGVLRGSLIGEPHGGEGFGYDPIFVPEGESRTTAEMSAAEKNAISHRGRAFRLLAERVWEVLG
ncbi:XTP/dITP diphosphohydrolase [Lipingzhangella halophila]|uniref:dITP/XTP pyrophosphatase n=1 Tax=Lipingzhangella halophila TaxID=1783352 RepID=A0A7W7RKL6_9ACTN|nr:RdgB/HAM1 family non-canonical purine NTP pyrophosphatase [Lipingzhangella halophila]MBB4933680.1 XTP/dITP diphosphohydrolase [Lipingzhangella halophila]